MCREAERDIGIEEIVKDGVRVKIRKVWGRNEEDLRKQYQTGRGDSCV